MAFLDFLGSPKEQALFRSYWVHTLFQFLVVTFFLFRENQTLISSLIVLLSYFPTLIAYVIFQFPVTSVLILLANRFMEKLIRGQGLFVKIIVSTGLFVIMAGSLVLFLLFLFSSVLLKENTFGSSLGVVLTYILPVLFLAELFRQWLVMKRVYFETQSDEQQNGPG